MTNFHAAILGAVQGATEFLPVSSTAHILLVDKLVFGQDTGAAFTAIIQWGTVLAALVYFRKDILSILFGKPAPDAVEPDGSQMPGRSLLIPIVVGTVPIVVLGLVAKHAIEHRLRGMMVVAISMIVFAIALAVAERLYRPRREIGSITVADGLMVGIAQCFALIPGASRSGTTITGAMFTGLERATAARFSFLLGLPAIFGAGVKELWDYRHHIQDAGGVRPLVIATVVAFIVGYASIDWLLKFLKRHPTYVFIVYRIIVGLILVGLLMSGRIKDTPETSSQEAHAILSPLHRPV